MSNIKLVKWRRKKPEKRFHRKANLLYVFQEIAQKQVSTKKHIEAKLKALREVAGEDIPIRVEDLEEDFDPKKFDERMKVCFCGVLAIII